MNNLQPSIVLYYATGLAMGLGTFAALRYNGIGTLSSDAVFSVAVGVLGPFALVVIYCLWLVFAGLLSVVFQAFDRATGAP